jgi:hypothetical protein
MSETVYIKSKCLDSGDHEVRVGDKLVGYLLRDASGWGYNIVLNFNSVLPLEEERIKSLYHGMALFKTHYETTFGQKLSF